MKQLDLVVKHCNRLSDKVVHLVLCHDNPLPEMKPGQFVQVLVPDKGVLLRRPISVHDVSYEDNALHLLVQNVGRGTHALCNVRTGDSLNVVLPLGNGFPMLSSGHVLLVGGGVGIAPLLYLGRRLKENGCNVDFLLGGRSRADILRRDVFASVACLFTTTEDGSDGERGFVTNHSVLQDVSFDCVMVCGPTPMMRAVAAWARNSAIPCYVSLENMMACGLGACLCCVQKDANGHNVCVCKEGPVFNISNLDWK